MNYMLPQRGNSLARYKYMAKITYIEHGGAENMPRYPARADEVAPAVKDSAVLLPRKYQRAKPTGVANKNKSRYSVCIKTIAPL